MTPSGLMAIFGMMPPHLAGQDVPSCSIASTNVHWASSHSFFSAPAGHGVIRSLSRRSVSLRTGSMQVDDL